jgi:hypothetical protein
MRRFGLIWTHACAASGSLLFADFDSTVFGRRDAVPVSGARRIFGQKSVPDLIALGRKNRHGVCGWLCNVAKN